MSSQPKSGLSSPGANAQTLRVGRMLVVCLALGAGVLALLVGDVSAQTASNQQAQDQSAAPGSPDCGTDWTRVASPNADTLDNRLTGIAVISRDDIWAVGYDVPLDGNAATLTEHWDGNSWTVVDSPSPHSDALLFGVAAIATNNVWAVGLDYTGNGVTQHALIEHWNGMAWTVSTGPDPGEFSELHGVAAIGPGDVWAVGLYYLFGQDVLLTEHWDGNSWTMENSPNPGTGYRTFTAVAAIATNNVWAVGYYDNGAGDRALAEHWNGNQWSVVNASGVHDYHLYGISAVAANDIWAVGDNDNGTTLTEHWDGTQWSVFPSPSPGTHDNVLYSVTAISANNAWAVGGGADHLNQYFYLLEHWNGNTWNVFDAVSEGSTNDLAGVAAVSADDVWAVGDYRNINTDFYRTVIERRQLCATPTPTRTNTPTRTPTHPPTRTPRPTQTPGGPTPTPCVINFTDVPPDYPFYSYISYLYCQGVISGYADNTFRPGNPTTRGQLTKIVVLAVGWPVNCPAQPHFSDVPTDHPFYCYIETAYAAGIISGYGNGTFQPGNNVTRGQLSKIVVSAMGWTIDCPAQPHFSDVPTTYPFYCYIETAYAQSIISGYADGTFLPGNNATRGQISKIVYLAVTHPSRSREAKLSGEIISRH